MGTTARELIEELRRRHASTGRRLKAWTPGGSSTPFLTAEHLDVGDGLRVGARRPGRCSGPRR